MLRNSSITLLLSCVLAVTACGGGGGSSPLATLSPPAVAATSSATQGSAPLAITFDASGSSDPQGYLLSFSWNFGDGSAMATGSTASHTYNAHGTYTATVTVNDGHTSATKSVTIQVVPAPPTVQALTIAVNVLGVAPTTTQAQIVASDRENLPLTYSISMPSVGTATVNANTGAISYSVPGYPSVSSTSFTLTVSNGSASTISTVNVALNGDPLLPNQWHIQNVGQDAFASALPVAGNDMDVTGAWAAGYSGKGIKVGIVDTGLEAAHEDLAANVDS